ncbi:unnamed protein product [Didymodactylos carnosus]|uniref:Uncharacterized protein n=1 Tax=Didymodactylos carnosus TaxID=1234261 RepID=A0A815UWZ2_9BILA|nr:unnamed protein product [Didymodactylos carnosus]CAF1528519.1 unnamed protein product [Didymodactylos carnosus]CAF4169789.1 unnamed protein product [Didymodactylos carnosus]CAF4387688.1 unnamed protein product [Didymodactylos carnosus]
MYSVFFEPSQQKIHPHYPEDAYRWFKACGGNDAMTKNFEKFNRCRGLEACRDNYQNGCIAYYKYPSKRVISLNDSANIMSNITVD